MAERHRHEVAQGNHGALLVNEFLELRRGRTATALLEERGEVRFNLDAARDELQCMGREFGSGWSPGGAPRDFSWMKCNKSSFASLMGA